MKSLQKFLAILFLMFFGCISPAIANDNPFEQVPKGHWAYDAVELLASRGILSEIPETLKDGNRPATRYEVASVVAKAMAKVDENTSSQDDVDTLKQLTAEFVAELDALGVKIDSLKKKVEHFSGWKLSGQFWFDANFASGDQSASSYTETGNDNAFQKDRIRLAIQKQINEDTSFYAQFRGGSEGAGSGGSGVGDVTTFNVRDVYVDTLLPYGINFRVGRFLVNIERKHGLQSDNEPTFGDYRIDGFKLAKSWAQFSAELFVGRNSALETRLNHREGGESISFLGGFMHYGLDLTWYPNETFSLGASGIWMKDDGDTTASGGSYDFSTYSIYASYDLLPSVSIKGIYYLQSLGRGIVSNGQNMSSLTSIDSSFAGNRASDDTAHAWKIMADVKQNLLGIADLHLEYMEHDNTFVAIRNPYSFDVDTGNSASVAYNIPWNDETTRFVFIRATHKWNSKWSAYIRYQYADYGTDGISDAVGYGVGVTYQYTPAIAFRLAFDEVDYGWNNPSSYNGKDRIIQFRTAINF